jgi:hypothetical protein
VTNHREGEAPLFQQRDARAVRLVVHEDQVVGPICCVSWIIAISSRGAVQRRKA